MSSSRNRGPGSPLPLARTPTRRLPGNVALLQDSERTTAAFTSGDQEQHQLPPPSFNKNGASSMTWVLVLWSLRILMYVLVLNCALEISLTPLSQHLPHSPLLVQVA